MQEELEKFPVTKTIEVQWGEMDAANHVNNTVYLRWGEAARIAYFDSMGYSVTGKEQLSFILAWQDCKYIRPVTYPDMITIGVKVTAIEKDFLNMECHYFSEKLNRLVAISKQKVVTYDYVNLCKVDVSETMKSIIQKIEKS